MGESSHSSTLGHLLNPLFCSNLTGRSVPLHYTHGKSFKHLNSECVYILQIGSDFRDLKNKQNREPGLLEFSVHSLFITSALLFLLGLGGWYLGVLSPDSQKVTCWEETYKKYSHQG